MLGLLKRWEDYFTGITFAEVGEFDLARFFVKRKRDEKSPSLSWDEIFTAITFAEAGEADTARLILHSKRRVLLIIERLVDKEMLSYVKGLCQRLNLPVEILLFQEDSLKDENLEDFLSALKAEGTLFKVTKVESKVSMEKILTEYLRKNQGVDYLIIKPTFSQTEKEDERLIKTLWERLGSPFVLIKEREAH